MLYRILDGISPLPFIIIGFVSKLQPLPRRLRGNFMEFQPRPRLPKGPNERRKGARGHPKEAERTPKSAQRRPRAPKDVQGKPQREPTGGTASPKSSQRRPKAPQKHPRAQLYEQTPDQPPKRPLLIHGLSLKDSTQVDNVRDQSDFSKNKQKQTHSCTIVIAYARKH